MAVPISFTHSLYDTTLSPRRHYRRTRVDPQIALTAVPIRRFFACRNLPVFPSFDDVISNRHERETLWH
jgi:hypothetical protein